MFRFPSPALSWRWIGRSGKKKEWTHEGVWVPVRCPILPEGHPEAEIFIARQDISCTDPAEKQPYSCRAKSLTWSVAEAQKRQYQVPVQKRAQEEEEEEEEEEEALN